MATDIAPALLSAIQVDFQRRIERNVAITRLSNRIRDGTAKLSEVHDYAQLLGEMLSQSLLANFTEDALPDGRLYWNIANRTIRPMLKEAHAAVNTAAKTVQQSIDEAQGLGLSPLAGEFDEERADRLIGAAAQESNTFAQMQTAITEPVINCTESFFDDFVSANADFRYQTGLETKVVREAAPGCCAWCEDLAETYNPLEARDAGAYRRHQYCRCTTTFVSGRTRQDVWSKRVWQASGTQLQERKSLGLELFRLTPEEAAVSVADSAKRDAAIASIMKEKGISRERASYIYRRQNSGRR